VKYSSPPRKHVGRENCCEMCHPPPSLCEGPNQERARPRRFGIRTSAWGGPRGTGVGYLHPNPHPPRANTWGERIGVRCATHPNNMKGGGGKYLWEVSWGGGSLGDGGLGLGLGGFSCFLTSWIKRGGELEQLWVECVLSLFSSSSSLSLSLSQL
jgi:hypothetical protein